MRDESVPWWPEFELEHLTSEMKIFFFVGPLSTNATVCFGLRFRRPGCTTTATSGKSSSTWRKTLTSNRSSKIPAWLTSRCSLAKTHRFGSPAPCVCWTVACCRFPLLAEGQTFQRAGLCPPQPTDQAGRAEAGGDGPAADAHQSQTWHPGGEW